MGYLYYVYNNFVVKMFNPTRIEKLKAHLESSRVDHGVEIMQVSNLKDAHIYCLLNNISAQQYGVLLERYIITKYNYTKNDPKNCTGDCYKSGNNIEVKVSLGGVTHTKFNFVQLRLSHELDYYVLTAYHLSPENVNSEGELYIFKIPKHDIIKLIAAHGGYAHGTIKEHGSITIESLKQTNTREYVLRTSFNDKCWNSLLAFRIDESDL